MTMFLLGNAQAGPLGASALFCVKNVAFAERLVDPCGRPLRTAEGNPKNACTAATWDVVVGSAAIAEQTDGCTTACCKICAAAVALSDTTTTAVVGLSDASAISFLPKAVAGVVNGSAIAGVVGYKVVLKIIIIVFAVYNNCENVCSKTYLRIFTESGAAAVFKAVTNGTVGPFFKKGSNLAAFVLTATNRIVHCIVDCCVR